MLAQSKTFIDAARKARIQHIVHLGVFGHWDCTDPPIAWHQLVETYIEASSKGRREEQQLNPKDRPDEFRLLPAFRGI